MGDTISLVNTSTNAAVTDWVIDNVYFSSEKNVRLPLSITGSYNVVLNTATCNNTSSFTADLYVINCLLPMVNIMATTREICANSQVTFSDVSTNVTGWQWSFPGGNPSTSTLQNPVVTYSQPGTYSVLLTASNSYGSQSSMQLNYITVNANPSVPVITATGNLFTSTPATTYQWYLNNLPVLNSNAQQITAAGDGYYSVIVQNEHSCASISLPIFYSLTNIEQADDNRFNAFPNPTSGILQITLPPNSHGSVAIYDASGHVVQVKTVENAGNLSTNLAGLPAGAYRIVFTDNNYKISQLPIIKY
jgi:PKD repeat protein